MFKVAPKCSEMLVACRYGGINLKCTNIFNSILTDGGLCCNFNAVHRKFLMNMTYKLESINFDFRSCIDLKRLIYIAVDRKTFKRAIHWKKWPMCGRPKLDFNRKN